jgi:hypothetical protein
VNILLSRAAILVYVINLVPAFLISRYEQNASSDKTIIISSVIYLLLITINLMCAFFLGIDKKPLYKAFLVAVVLLTVMYFSRWDKVIAYIITQRLVRGTMIGR